MDISGMGNWVNMAKLIFEFNELMLFNTTKVPDHDDEVSSTVLAQYYL